MPVGAIDTAGAGVMRLIRRLREELGVNTTCGASNFSFGLPNRHGLNASFLSMAIGAGMTSAITNPMHLPEMEAVKGADLVMGHDPRCKAWIKSSKKWEVSRAQGQTLAASVSADKAKVAVDAEATNESKISRRMMRKLRVNA